MLKTAPANSGPKPFEPHMYSASSYLAFNGSAHHHRHHHKDVPRHHGLRKARENALQERVKQDAAVRASAHGQAQQESRNVAVSYLEQFLETSEWQDNLDCIGIIHEAVPTMEQLQSYGGLEEGEGTRACRKMFRAVVVWEQVGRSLWQRLRDNAQKGGLPQDPTDSILPDTPSLPASETDLAVNRPGHQRAAGSRDLQGLSIIPEQPKEPAKTRQPSLASLASTLTRGRKPSLSSLMSSERHPSPRTRSTTSSQRPSPGRRRSSSVPAPRKGTMHLQGHCDCCANGEHDPARRATDPGPRYLGEDGSPYESEAGDGPPGHTVRRAATLPRKVSKNCASAVKRTFEALHDSRGRHGHSRRASIGH